MLRRQFEFGRTGCALEAQRLTDTSGRASPWDEKGIGKLKTSQASDVGSIPIARSINPVDAVELYWLPTLKFPYKNPSFGRSWTRIPAAVGILDATIREFFTPITALNQAQHSRGTLLERPVVSTFQVSAWVASVPVLSNRFEGEYLADISATSEFRDTRQVVRKRVSPLSRRCIGWEHNAMDPEKNISAASCHVAARHNEFVFPKRLLGRQIKAFPEVSFSVHLVPTENLNSQSRPFLK